MQTCFFLSIQFFIMMSCFLIAASQGESPLPPSFARHIRFADYSCQVHMSSGLRFFSFTLFFLFLFHPFAFVSGSGLVVVEYLHHILILLLS